MNANIHYGDWSKLTDYLKHQYPRVVILTDDDIAVITGSVDERQVSTSHFPIDDNPEWSIKQRAAAAGYSVEYDPTNKRIKIFRPIGAGAQIPSTSAG